MGFILSQLICLVEYFLVAPKRYSDYFVLFVLCHTCQCSDIKNCRKPKGGGGGAPKGLASKMGLILSHAYKMGLILTIEVQ